MGKIGYFDVFEWRDRQHLVDLYAQVLLIVDAAIIMKSIKEGR